MLEAGCVYISFQFRSLSFRTYYIISTNLNDNLHMISPRKNMLYENVLLLVTLFAISILKAESQVLVESKNENSGVITPQTDSAYYYDYDCSEEDFDCGGGECISSEHVCDKIVDCDDGKDEAYCKNITKPCGEDEFYCGEHFCITKEKVCDGFLNCHNSLDERDCAPRNHGAQTTTATKTEATTTQTTDEDNYEYEADCYEHEYACEDDICINKTQLCDGKFHCTGGEDELDCPEPSPSETTQSLRTSTITVVACKNSQFKCLNERCIESNKLCDGKDDCGDSSDENTCQATTTSIIIKKVLSTTKMTAPSSGCTYKREWYPPGSEIVPGDCIGITCTSSGRVRRWEDPTCAGCISAKMNRMFICKLRMTREGPDPRSRRRRHNKSRRSFR